MLSIFYRDWVECDFCLTDMQLDRPTRVHAWCGWRQNPNKHNGLCNQMGYSRSVQRQCVCVKVVCIVVDTVPAVYAPGRGSLST